MSLIISLLLFDNQVEIMKKYQKYNDKYYENTVHLKLPNYKKVAINILSKNRFVSTYYFNLINIIQKLPKNAKIIDLGCSNGGFLNFLGQVRPDLCLNGLDISDVHNLVPKNVNFIQKDIISENLDIGKFDAVFSRHLIEHLNVSDVPIFFNKCNDLLKKEGICFVLCPTISYDFFSDPTHIRPYNKYSLERLFKISNFESIQVFEGHEYNFPVTAIKKGMKLCYGYGLKK